MPDYQELTSLEAKREVKAPESEQAPEAKEKPAAKPTPDYQKSLPVDVTVGIYQPKRSRNWTFDPIKYNDPQHDIPFFDRTFCQLLGTAAALTSVIFGLVTLANYPWWVVTTYAMTAWGLSVGAVWDIYNACVPVNPWMLTVMNYRRLNASFVSTCLLNHLIFCVVSDYSYIAYTVPLNAWWFVLVLVPSYTGFTGFFGHHKGPGPLLLALSFSITTQMINLITAQQNGLPSFDSPYVAFNGWRLIMAASIGNYIGALCARHLAVYHAIMCLTFFMLTFCLDSYGSDFLYNTRYGSAQPNFWYLFLGWVVGLFLVFFKQPLQTNTLRRQLKSFLWSRIWAKLLSLPPWDPVPLDLQNNKNQPFLGTKALWLGARPDEVSGFKRASELCIPISEFIPASQFHRIDGTSVESTFGFGGIFDQLSFLDTRFSQNRCNQALSEKVRFAPGQDGAYWFPLRLAFSGPPPKPPASIIQAKNEGRLLEFLVWYGHLSPELRKVTARDHDIMGNLEGATHVIDLEWMSEFDVKPDYHRTGGRAFFRLDAPNTRLNVLYITLPRETRKIYPQRNAKGQNDWEFDQAEQVLLTSSYALVVVGYHAGGIHTMMSLLSVALHNGFDTNDGPFFHPWRLAMHLHFFNHILVNDSTTVQFLEKSGVFSQIFPWTVRGLYEFIQTVVANYEYMGDADIEARRAVTDGVMPPESTLVWEAKYKKIFVTYGQMIADLCWKNDGEVAQDVQMQKFLRNLSSNIPKGLPQRFRSGGVSQFSSKAQVAEFMASAIQIVTCRHEVYGTLFGNWAFEPRIMQSQLPLDFGPPAVEHYQALLGVTMATSRRPAPKLMIRDAQMPGEKTVVGPPKNEKGQAQKDFFYLIRNVPAGDEEPMKKAFDYLQQALNALYVEMAGTRELREKAHWFLQMTPDMLELGASY